MKSLKFTFKPLTFSATALIAFAALTNLAVGQDVVSEAEFEQAAAAALPELSQPAEQIRSSSASMSCFVDTPAFDQFTTGFCFSVGTAFMTTAVFRIDNPPSNFTILWSDSRCSSNSLTCFLPIRHFQTITLSATVLNNSNNTFVNTSATARYESFQ